MELNLTEEEFAELKDLLRQKHAKISGKRIREQWDKIANSQQIFPLPQQRVLLLQLLDNYSTTKKKVVIYLDELEADEFPKTLVLGAMAEDWPGMSNSILGILHHRHHNVLYVKGFTLDYEDRRLGVVIFSFRVSSREEYKQFSEQKKELIAEIKDAAQGTTGKSRLLTDEAVKYEIYNKIIKKIKELYHSTDLVRVIEESGEVLKFVSSRSREYLEERRIKDLSHLILDNYIYQNMIRSGATEEVIKIKNFKTNTEELTGITFVCKEDFFSIEDFLKTLDHIVPDHIIRHHKSFVTDDGILIYRIEIVDRNEKALDYRLTKSIENSMVKSIAITCNKKFTKLKAVGGIEHYARAIIPFLAEEVTRTKLTQVFIHVEGKTQFLIDFKVVIVSPKARKNRIHSMISKLTLVPGIDVTSSIPPKIHRKNIEINFLKLLINLSEFSSIREIYNSIKEIASSIFGDIRDFDEGFRDIYIRSLNQLMDRLKMINPLLVREIYFSLDELCRIEIAQNVLDELIKLCDATIRDSQQSPGEKLIWKYTSLTIPSRSLLVISYSGQKRQISRIIQKLKDVDVYFTRIEWDQRSYVLMILSQNNQALNEKFIEELVK